MSGPNRLKPHWFQILLALSDEDRHGQGIATEVLRQTDGTMRLWPTSLYGSLKRLDESGFVEESTHAGASGEGDRRRFYRITDRGKEAVADEVSRLQKTVELALHKQETAK